MEIITSVNNNRIKELAKLHTKKYRDESKFFLVEGDHLVNEAYKKNQLVEIFALESFNEKLDVETTIVSEEVMKKLSNQVSISNVIGVCRKFYPLTYGKRLIVLDNLQDPGNLGTIIRSAASFNFDTVILGDNSVDLYNDKVIRASEGMIFNVDVLKYNLDTFIDELKSNNYDIYTTDVNGGKAISDVEFNEKFAIIIGNEGNGVGKIRDKADHKIYIPMNKKCESLNAAVASSIIMYEVSKRDYE